jgi:DNA-directed RNA polymerase specialized sigma24 family protein
MELPDGITEADFMAAFDKVMNVLARKYRFGPFDRNDIYQEGFSLALEALPRYDRKRPLENFLYVHLSNRLKNFKRNNFYRAEAPCKGCAHARPGEAPHPGGVFCDRHLGWVARNRFKQNVMSPASLDNAPEKAAALPEAVNEVAARLDRGMPAHLRADYLRMRAGEKLGAARAEAVREAAREILGGFNDAP